MASATGTTADIHGKLVTFLANEMAREEHHASVKIELLYMPPGQFRREPIKSWHRSQQVDARFFTADAKEREVYLDQLAQEMLELAEYHADSFGMGKHPFKVISHHAMGGGRHTHNFVMLPSSDAGSADGELVGPGQSLEGTPAGLQLQLMRHLENQQRLNKDMMTSFVGTMREVMGTMREDNERLHALVRSRDDARVAELKELEAARSEEHNRQIEAATVTAEIERKGIASKRIFGLLPVIASKIIEGVDEKNGSSADEKAAKAGKKWKPSPLAIAIGELAASLTDEQQEILRANLSIEQQIMLARAIELGKKGGSVMLPMIVADLAEGLEREQLTKILAALDGDQQKMFVRVTQLAKAEADPAATTSKKSAGEGTAPPNGA